MPKYMFKTSYSSEGAAGLLKDGGTKRRDLAKSIVEAAGGTLEAFYFAFGDEDAYIIADLPDHATVSAISLHVSASGAVAATTIVLVTPEEIDAASKMKVDYRPPGA
jgi:uncharacterized protein with GYD domain